MRTYVSLFFSAVFLLLLATPTPARAQADNAESQYQNPFSDYVPFEDEYDVDEDERFMYFGRTFALSLGTGAQVFGGNIGKLYNTALPVFNFSLLYFFDFRLAGQIHFNSSSHAYAANPNGFTEVRLLRAGFDLKYYFDTKELSAALTSANPYIIAGVGNTFRTQVFQDFGAVDKDTALTLSGGLGMEFALTPKKVSIGVEGRLYQIYFRDRYAETFIESGIEDTTGPLYSIATNILFFF